MGLRCYFAHKRASAYLDGNCPERARKRLETHLEECPVCERYLAEVRQVHEMLGRLGHREASKGRIARRVWQKIDARAPSGRLREAASDMPAALLRFAAGFMLALGLSAGVFFGRAIAIPSEAGRGYMVGLSSGEEAEALYALAVERSDNGLVEGLER